MEEESDASYMLSDLCMWGAGTNIDGTCLYWKEREEFLALERNWLALKSESVDIHNMILKMRD